MTGDWSELYQEVILDHGKRPHNFGEMIDADRSAEGFNPLCGDKITVYVQTNGDEIKAIQFSGTACAICTASASMMTDAVQTKTTAEAEQLFDQVRRLLTEDNEIHMDGLGPIAALGGVRRFPMRVKCATLPWHTMKAALQDESGRVSTE